MMRPLALLLCLTLAACGVKGAQKLPPLEEGGKPRERPVLPTHPRELEPLIPPDLGTVYRGY